MNKRRRFKAKRARRFIKIDNTAYSLYSVFTNNVNGIETARLVLKYYQYLDKLNAHRVHVGKPVHLLY